MVSDVITVIAADLVPERLIWIANLVDLVIADGVPDSGDEMQSLQNRNSVILTLAFPDPMGTWDRQGGHECDRRTSCPE